MIVPRRVVVRKSRILVVIVPRMVVLRKREHCDCTSEGSSEKG